MSAEEKFTSIPGTVEVDEGVIQDLIGYVALTSYGVAGMAMPGIGVGISKMLPLQKLRRGIVLENHGDSVSVDMYIVVQYGTNLSAVAENLADAVRYELEQYLQVPVEDISINIQGVKI